MRLISRLRANPGQALCQWLVLMLAAWLFVPGMAAQELPPCGEREHVTGDLWADTSLWCIEDPIHDDSGGELAFAALAVGDDGTLYATRPLTGEVLALDDSDGDGLPDRPRVIAENLTLPNGLVYDAGSLVIAGGSHLYRWADGQLDVLVDDLPAGGGFWTGGVTIGPDGRIYVATGAPCDACVPDDPARGAILSFDRDGQNRQLVTTGLRQPGDVAWHGGVLWTLDTLRDGLDDFSGGDELNRVTPGAHFGWPYCIGADNQADLETGDFDCADATAPALSFPTYSNPLALAAYTSDTLPSLQGKLLVVLGGISNSIYLEGYQLVAVDFDAKNQPTGYTTIIPAPFSNSSVADWDATKISYEGLGLWPSRPLGVAVSPEGWVYLSVGGGRIFVLRPL